MLVAGRRPAGTSAVVERSLRQAAGGDGAALVATRKTTESCSIEE